MKTIKICDTHNDFLTELEEGQIEAYVVKCKNNGVEKVCASFWSTKIEDPIGFLKKRIRLIENSSDVCLLHIEDLWWVKDEADLAEVLKLNPFSCSLTWNDENALAGGSKSLSGLTEWGKVCLLKLAEQGVLVDVAHLNRKSFWQVTKLLRKNIYCSHTGFYGVKRSERNLTDKQIDFIVKSDGFVGLFFFDKCTRISKPNMQRKGVCPFGADDIIDNIEYFTSRWGFDNVGIGTDFYGIENYPLGIEDYTDFNYLAEKMKARGFSEENINKIFYDNFVDFLARVKKTD